MNRIFFENNELNHQISNFLDEYFYYTLNIHLEGSVLIFRKEEDYFKYYSDQYANKYSSNDLVFDLGDLYNLNRFFIYFNNLDFEFEPDLNQDPFDIIKEKYLIFKNGNY